MNRILLLLISALLISDVSYAQGRDGQPLIRRKDAPVASACPRVYIGFSTGINNPVGILGPQVDVAISPSLSIGSGVGISSWGYKTFLEARYYFKPCNRGWAVGGGVTYNTGADAVELKNAETIFGEQDVVVELHSQTNFMVSGYHFFNLGRARRNRFHLQFGFSVPLTEKSFDQVGGAPLTKDGGNTILAIAPGGLILGLGFSFGAGSM